MKKILLFLFMIMGNVVSFANVSQLNNVKSVTAITESFGVGQTLTGVVIEYTKEIDAKTVNIDTYQVVDRTITEVYVSDGIYEEKKDLPSGKFVNIRLSTENKEGLLFIKSDNMLPAEVVVRQVKDIQTTNRKIIKNWGNYYIGNDAVKRLVVDEFKQFEYYDPKTDVTIKYNLYIPKNYDENKKYPLVMFIHDAGPLSDDTKTTLYQGNGATTWATEKTQQKYQTFVLAPQFDTKLVEDDGTVRPEVDGLVNLLRDEILKKYSINENKIYTTGQSMGGMMSIVMNSRYPDLFAASYYVACQWDTSIVAPLANQKMWVVVSEGDQKAYPGWQDIIETITPLGATVNHISIDGSESVETIDDQLAVQLANSEDVNVRFTTIKKGTLPELQVGNPGSEHMATWKEAYKFEVIKDWLLEQEK